ncbi:MAG: ferritin family protein [Tepidanaerobacteraceae bacterium]
MVTRGSKTYENLMRAFAGESQARNRYNIATSIARKEGFYVVASVFDYTADQERAHAKVFYQLLKDFRR